MGSDDAALLRESPLRGSGRDPHDGEGEMGEGSVDPEGRRRNGWSVVRCKRTSHLDQKVKESAPPLAKKGGCVGKLFLSNPK